ncbi:MAG TPA: HNH endonuclease [Vicinamibacterales bacterium]|nr:HNH endonuclease [Vicinamibacterales bacterium]
MKLWLAVTDGEWFRFLRSQPVLDEVNFWQPGGHHLFKALEPGQPFLFKLHAPEHFVVGGGYFRHASLLPASLAWEVFGVKNGAASFEDMRRRIERYRRVPTDPRAEYTIGCILLVDPFFFDEHEWIQPPADFHRNIVQGKSYDLTSSTGRALWEQVRSRLVTRRPGPVDDPAGPAIFSERVVRQRLGQGTFRVLITDVYQRRCAVTGEKALPVLEAAHIRPLVYGGTHRVDNGLLLRSDIHILYDRGYVAVTPPPYRFLVSRRLREDFDNGEQYYRLNGRPVYVPRESEHQPNREFLEWHTDTIFKG